MLADNLFERSLAPSIENFTRQERGARVVLSRGARDRAPSPPRRRRARRTTGSSRIVEKPVDPPSEYAVTGVYMYDGEVWDVLPTLEPSGRGELEITDVNNWYVEHGQMEYDVVDGFWGDAGESIEAYYAVNDFVAATARHRDRGTCACSRCGGSRTSAAGSSSSAASGLPKPTRQTNVSFSRAGVIRGLHYHERGQDDLFCLPVGDGPRRRARPGDRRDVHARTSATTTRSPSTSPASTRTGSRRSPTLFRYHVTEEYDPAEPDEHGDAVGRPARRRPLEHPIADPVGTGRAAAS